MPISPAGAHSTESPPQQTAHRPDAPMPARAGVSVSRALAPRGPGALESPHTGGCATFDPTGCLIIGIRLEGARPATRYDVGLTVYGRDIATLGGVRRTTFSPAAPGGDDVARPAASEFRLGAVRTDGCGRARFQRILSPAPGFYGLHAWAAPRAPAARLTSGEGPGDCVRLVVDDGPDVGRYLRLRRRPRAVRAVRRAAAAVMEPPVAARDLRRLRNVLPELAGYDALAREHRRALEPYRREYVSTVSSDIMTVSLETAALLAVLCETRAPRRIVDLGSGFSSFVLRRYAATAARAPEVWSVDDSPEWLERTAEYLAAQGVAGDRLSTWQAFDEPPSSFDLVLHDLGRPALRMAALPTALALLRAGGVLVVDDLHKAAYRPYARHVARRSGLRCLSARTLTIDRFGRYAGLVLSDGAEGR